MTEHPGDRPEEHRASDDTTAVVPPVPSTATPPVEPVAPAAPAAHPQPVGAPAYTGQAFGATQPTLPLAPPPVPEHKRSSAGRVVALLAAAALVGGAAGLGGSALGSSLWTTGEAGPAAVPSVVTVNDAGDVNATTAVATKVLPSTVTISASGGSAGGTGSGVVLTEDGYVLTNTHVVTLDGATGSPSLTVTSPEGKVYQATLVGTDPTYDLAVIKLKNASGLTPIEFGRSSGLNVGDETIAIGAPLGLSNTVTTGIVSALNRSIEIASSAAPDSSQDDDQGNGDRFQFDFGQGQNSAPTKSTIKIAVIQTDAAINPGNSGGALVDSEGKLIGINVAIATAGGPGSGQSGNGSIGVGFAIPSDIAQRIANDIVESGAASHGLLGADVRNAATVEGSGITGAYIARVTADGAAAAAGIVAGDTVTAFNGVPVTNGTDLTAQVRALPAGAKAEVTFVRNGQSRTVEVSLGTLG